MCKQAKSVERFNIMKRQGTKRFRVVIAYGLGIFVEIGVHSERRGMGFLVGERYHR